MEEKEAIRISKSIFLGFLLISVLLLSACKSQPIQQNPPETNLKCGIQNCHGLDIACGQNVPEVCTEEYQLGDFCRKFAACKVVNGQCQIEQNDKFEQCKSCVEGCKGLGFQKIFECESNCRKKFE